MTALCAVLAISVFACGGGGSGGGDDDDDVPTDGPGNNPTPDGPGPNPQTSAIGTTCTPDQNNPQGSCPAGFTCLNLEGATNPWCSKTCTGQMDTSCATGYDGPGKAACLLTVTPQGGGATQTFCGVICEDLTGSNGVCQAGECTGDCPGSMACTGDVQGSSGGGPAMTIAHACE